MLGTIYNVEMMTSKKVANIMIMSSISSNCHQHHCHRKSIEQLDQNEILADLIFNLNISTKPVVFKTCLNTFDGYVGPLDQSEIVNLLKSYSEKLQQFILIFPFFIPTEIRIF